MEYGILILNCRVRECLGSLCILENHHAESLSSKRNRNVLANTKVFDSQKDGHRREGLKTFVKDFIMRYDMPSAALIIE